MFPHLPGGAEVLVRCGGKIKYLLIACFLGSICAKSVNIDSRMSELLRDKFVTFLGHSVHVNLDIALLSWFSLQH